MRRHPAVALVLDEAERARLGDREVDAGDARLRLEELPAQHAPRDRRERVDVLRVLGVRGSSRPNSRAICCRFLWIAGMMMCDGVSPSSWMMYSPRSRLEGLDAVLLEEVVQVHLLGDHRLALDERAWRRARAQDLEHDRVGLVRVVSAQWTRMPFARHRSSSRSRSSGSFASVRARIAAPSARRSRHSTGSANCAARLAMRPSMARRKFARSCGSRAPSTTQARKSGERGLSAHGSAPRGTRRGAAAATAAPLREARRRCSGGSRRRRRAGSSAPVATTSATLSSTIAAEIVRVAARRTCRRSRSTRARARAARPSRSESCARSSCGSASTPHLAQGRGRRSATSTAHRLAAGR